MSSLTDRVHLSDRAFTILLFAVPALLVVAVYWPYLSDAFVWDDWFWLRGVEGHSLLEVARRGFSFPTATEFDPGTPFFRPATDISFKFEVMAFGLNAMPYHLVNVGLHIAACGLGAVIVARTTGSRFAGFATACVFAIYPAQEIAVTWISQLAELLAVAAALLAMAAFQRYLVAAHRDGHRWLAVSFVALAIAALAKESQTISIVLFPALVLVTPGRQRSNREVARTIAIFGIVFGGYALFHAVHEYVDPQAKFYGLGTHVPGHVLDYLRWLSFPFWLNASWAEGVRNLGATLFLASGVFAVVTGRRVAGFFFFWTILWILPFSLFVGQIQYRYAYIPSLPFIAFAIAMILDLARALRLDGRRPLQFAAFGVLALLLAACARGARERQGFLTGQAAVYDAVMTRVSDDCRGTPQGGTVAIYGYPLFDPFGVTVRAGVDYYLGDVHVTMPPTPSGTGADCFVQNPGPR